MNIKKFTFRISSFVVLIVLAQLVVVRLTGFDQDFFPSPIHEYREVLKKNPDVLLLGDSAVYNGALNDQDRHVLLNLLKENWPDPTYGMIYHPGYHLHVYDSLVSHIVNHKFNPKVVIIPISLRSFSYEWDLQPQNQFLKEIFFLQSTNFLERAFFKPLCIFKAIDLTPLSDEEYFQLPVMLDQKVVGRVRDFDNKEEYEVVTEAHMKNQILFDYMYRIPPNHRKLKAIQNIIHLAEKNSIKILFYISPADVEFMEKYFGQDLQLVFQANISLIKSAIGEKAELIDLSEALSSDDFDWRKEKYPNDHRTLHGQEIVAKALSNKLREMLNFSKI